MNPALFRKLVEMKVIKVGTTVDVKYEVPNEQGRLIKGKGTFTIEKMYSHPFAFNTIVKVKDESNLELEVDFSNIQKIDGQEPIKVGAANGVRPDGCSADAPKRRGRKPKVRPEVDEVDEWSDNDDDDEDDEFMDENDMEESA